METSPVEGRYAAVFAASAAADEPGLCGLDDRLPPVRRRLCDPSPDAAGTRVLSRLLHNELGVAYGKLAHTIAPPPPLVLLADGCGTVRTASVCAWGRPRRLHRGMHRPHRNARELLSHRSPADRLGTGGGCGGVIGLSRRTTLSTMRPVGRRRIAAFAARAG